MLAQPPALSLRAAAEPGSPVALSAVTRRVAVSGVARPGKLVTLTGSGFRAGMILQARWDSASTRMRVIWVNSAGRFRASIRIPAGSGAGAHKVSLSAVTARQLRVSGGSSSHRLVRAALVAKVAVKVIGVVVVPPPVPPVSAAACGSSLQYRIDHAVTGATLDLTGCAYSLAAPVEISRAVTLLGGTVNAAATGLVVMASNVTISGMTLHGPRYSTNNDHRAVDILGPSTASYISNVRVTGNTISGWDGKGVYARYVDGFTIDGNNIANIYYAGIEGYSVRNGRITGNHVHNIVGTGNAYGIVLTRAYGTLAQYPRSTDVVVSGNLVEDVPHWEGLDTHGGQRIQFVNNTVRRARNAVMIGPSPKASGGLPQYAPLDVIVSGNTIESGVANGSRDVGIYFGGANAGTDVLGSSIELATGAISGNTVTGYGTQSNGDSAAIHAQDTTGLQITGNSVIDASPTAIAIYYNNYGFSVTGNTIRDPWSSSVSWKGAYGIFVHVDYNTGTISGNTFVRGSKSATWVLTRTVVVNAKPHNHVTVN